MGIRDEELDGLSDEERAALADDEDDLATISKIAGDGGDDEDGDDDESDDPAGAADAAKTDAGEKVDDDDQGAGDAGGDPDSTDTAAAVPDEFRPEFKAAVPEGLAEKLAGLETQTNDLLTKFKDGEIEMADFMAQKSAIDAEKLTLTLADAQAKWAESQNTETREQRWKWEQERFFGQEKAAIYKDPIILAALDASVKQLAADPANAKKPAGFYLEEADRQIRKRFNMGEPPVTREGKQPNRQPDLSRVPKTLAQLPAAEMAETGNEEFGYLDKLDGIALEQALRKLTPEQEARYLGVAS